MKLGTISTLVGMAAILLAAAFRIGALQQRVATLESQVQRCADKETQQTHDSWIKAWSDELNYRLRRLEERR